MPLHATRRAWLGALPLVVALPGAGMLSAARAQPAVPVPRTEQRTLRGPSGEYRILIGRPTGEPPATGWPVLYLLDGNAFFATAYDAVLSQGQHSDVTGVAPALVVGIGYPTDGLLDLRRRALDYTPALPRGAAAGGAAASPDGSRTGGADAFLDFVEGTLKPAINRDFPADPARQALFGHSYGGLCALHALFTRPAAFRDFLAVSPSIWFGDLAVLAGEGELPARLAGLAPPRGVFIAVGGAEQAPPEAGQDQPGADTRAARRDRRAMVDNARALAGRLATVPGLRAAFVLAEGENHASVVPTVLSRALRFALAPPG
ncbi:alpha/beta hydrolase-fold protein [Roseomonas sp. NAR14]|uniref:Acyl-CoA:diacylglycerol acyltransferase n=1 Tax=Roseomonas acroporae TaxID=2937791 RepID=A0A9X1Y8Y9_9PROT|nr:alpha/beta hydrolase-fold protein [Roseomonas acroporae]MCK8784307.1 alpha/beta hydrolase-fold protein [Roseomonas acroporae]